VNSFILYFGIVVVTTSLIGAFITKDYVLLGFGGVGLGSIITSLITNPTSAIGKSAKQIIQIQTAYFGLLNQIRILNGYETILKVGPIERSQRLQEAIKSVQETLNQNF
jgi:hypothetical protein